MVLNVRNAIYIQTLQLSFENPILVGKHLDLLFHGGVIPVVEQLMFQIIDLLDIVFDQNDLFLFYPLAPLIRLLEPPLLLFSLFSLW